MKQRKLWTRSIRPTQHLLLNMNKCSGKVCTVRTKRTRLTKGMSYYVGTVNGPTSITRRGVWKMYQKVASFSILDTPPQKQTLTIFWGGCKKFF